MNFKKIAVGAAGAALLLSAVAPVFADFDGTIIKNKAYVKNFTLTKADSGDNSITAVDDVKGGKIKTGDAVAFAAVTNVVNSNDVDTCGCDGFTLVKNKAKVKNKTLTFADSGDNTIAAGDDVRGGRIRTGDAIADSAVTNVVNTTVVGGGE